MRTITISEDKDLIETIHATGVVNSTELTVKNDARDALDMLSDICTMNPHVLIVDDDFLKPESGHFLSSIKKVLKNIQFIFCTSDSGLELGKQVSQLGVHYYGVKPVSVEEMSGALKSLKTLIEAKTGQTINQQDAT